MVKIFDVRTMKALPPVPFANGPAFVLVHPQNTSSLVISSSQGTIQVTDIDRPGESEFLQVSLTSPCLLKPVPALTDDLSSTCPAL